MFVVSVTSPRDVVSSLATAPRPGLRPVYDIWRHRLRPLPACLAPSVARPRIAHRQKSRVVELRYFGGLTIEETAEAMKISPATVKRD